MKKIALALSVVLFTLPAFAAPRQASLPSEFEARVDRVMDGDTFRFTARLLNIEIHDTCRMNEYNAPELHGKEQAAGEIAKHQLIKLIGGKTIRIRTSGKDKYGRWLCAATVGGASVGDKMRELLKDYPGRDKYL